MAVELQREEAKDPRMWVRDPPRSSADRNVSSIFLSFPVVFVLLIAFLSFPVFLRRCTVHPGLL